MAKGPHIGRQPAAMTRALAGLQAACAALTPVATPATIVRPIVGNSAPPAPAPLPADLPPGVAAAFTGLQAALASPPCMGEYWPFASPPAVQAAIDAQKRPRVGRPSTVTPHQVVRLARFVRLSHSIAAAAAKAGLPKSTAIDILKGRHSMAHHPSVQAAGVVLPHPPISLNGRKSVENPHSAPGGAAAYTAGHGEGRGSRAPVALHTEAAEATA